MTLRSALVLLLALACARVVSARDPRPSTPAAQSPAEITPSYATVVHDVGRLKLEVSNYGRIGPVEYPRGSYKQYLYSAGLWIGAIVDGDTLVTATSGTWDREFNPLPELGDRIEYRSTLNPARPYYEGAVSHQDFITVYSDTCISCVGVELEDRSHLPIWIEVTQRSYAWMYDYAQDLILLDFTIRNIGTKRLRQIYLGMYVDGDVHTSVQLSGEPSGNDDQVGFTERYPAMYLGGNCPTDSDLVNVGWTVDDDGNRWRPQEYAHVYDILGVSIVRAPLDLKRVSFNWWSQGWWEFGYDYGPQARATYRPLSWGNLGIPHGDLERYHFLRNNEKDPDQPLWVNIRSYDSVWIAPPVGMRDSLLSRMDPCYLLSFGPYGLEPGQSLPLTVAVVAGAGAHVNANMSEYLPDYPEVWLSRLNLYSLIRNTLWAKWIYDNPGVDTDSDGYAGEFTVCGLNQDSTWQCDTLTDSSADPDTNYIVCGWETDVQDTVWRTGDGVPDFKGAYPPPNPSVHRFVDENGDTVSALRVFPEVGKIRLVWNGFDTENTPDPFSHRYDFEGYAVYLAHDARPSSFSLMSSYDRENWFAWLWNGERHNFFCSTTPHSLEQLRCMYADSCQDSSWHPSSYSRDNPLVIPMGPKTDPIVCYFEPCGPNRSILANDAVNANTGIRKVYPLAPRPPYSDADSIAVYFPDRNDTTYFTPDGFLKYYEYEYVFDDLLPTVPYYVNVTAFDHGYPGLGLNGLEGDPAVMPRAVYALPSSEVIAEKKLDVFVYPNPYRLDADYRDLGYEASMRWHLPDDRTRLVHFANLPPKCTIRIFSLDGDLIRELRHDIDPDDYLANHATWDLINRNMQLVVSGLYYWTVEADDGDTQIGKLVIIM